MSNQQLSIDPRLFDEYPDVRIGVLVAHHIDNRGAHPEIGQKLEEAQHRVAEDLAGITVIEHPAVAPWRDAYRRFGAKPKKYPSSIENLVRRLLKGATLKSINPLVDLYNVVSLRHLLPVGGEDLERTEGSIRLTFAGPDEPSVLLLGERQERPPYPGEVIYTDDVGAICRRWNWKEADRTKLTPETRRAVLVIEALPPADEASLTAALEELAELIQRFCGGQAKSQLLGPLNPTVDLGS